MSWLSDTSMARLRAALRQPELSGTKYKVVEEIGRGGMGIVYSAKDTTLDRNVALKVLDVTDIESDAAARLMREARILAKLEHPGIVPVHDAGVLSDGRVFYTMKLVEGERLDDYAQVGRALPELLRVFLRICETVAFAHAAGIVHGDLKPHNIMTGRFGEVLVLDWGIARVMAEAGDAVAAGTPGFMAPEQARGEIGPPADVHALGRILEGLAGGAKALRSIAAKAADPDPARRYASVMELAADVARFMDGERVSAHRENLVERGARLLSRHRTLAALIAAYLLMRVLLFFFTRS
jgi:serine/threonine protein kinase